MNRRVRKTDNAERIANDVSRQIRGNKWEPGHVIPPLRTLAERYQVSHETVRRALQELEDRGLLRKIQGRGTVVESASRTRESAGSAFPPDPLFRKQLTVRSNEIGTEKGELWSRAADAFMAEQPNVAVTLAALSRFDFHPALDTMPDILHAPTWQLEGYAAAGLLLDLSPFCEEEPLFGSDLMPNTALPAGRRPVFHVPMTFDIRVMYVNLDRMPARELDGLRENWTVERVTAWMSRRAAGSKGGSGLPRPRVMLSLFGVNPLDVGGMKENLKRLPGVLDKLGALFRDCPFYEDSELHRDTDMQAIGDFLAQRTPLVFHHTFSMTTAVKRMKARWAVLPVPLAPGACPARYGMSCAITRNCPAPDAAMSLIRFLAGPRGQQIFASGKTNIPARLSAARSNAFLAAPPSGMGDIVESAGRTREYLHGGGQAFEMAWTAVWDEELLFFLLRRRPTAETVERIRRRCEILIRAHRLL